MLKASSSMPFIQNKNNFKYTRNTVLTSSFEDISCSLNPSPIMITGSFSLNCPFIVSKSRGVEGIFTTSSKSNSNEIISQRDRLASVISTPLYRPHSTYRLNDIPSSLITTSKMHAMKVLIRSLFFLKLQFVSIIILILLWGFLFIQFMWFSF